MTQPTRSETTFNDEELDALVARLISFNGDGYTRSAGKTMTEQAVDTITAPRTQLAELLAELSRRVDMHECAMAERDDATLYGVEQKSRADRAEQRVATLEAALAEIKQTLGAPDDWHPVYAVKALKQSNDRAEAERAAQVEADALVCDELAAACAMALALAANDTPEVRTAVAYSIKIAKRCAANIRAQPHDRTALDRLTAEHEVRLREEREISEAEKIAIRNKVLREAIEAYPKGIGAILALIDEDKEN